MLHVYRAAVAVVLASASAAPAQVIYMNQAAFNAVLAPGSYTETFTGPLQLGVQSLSYSGGSGYAYTVTAGNANGVYANGNFIGNFNNNNTFTVTFTGAPVRAIGGNFYISDQFDAFVAAPVTITYSNGTVDTFTPATVNDYRGFSVSAASPAITSLVMSASPNFNTIDNLTIGTVNPVPEPGSLALCGAAVAGLGWYRRRTGAG